VRSNYSDDELTALKEIMRLLAEEIGRNTKIMIADLDHLTGCESAEHKVTCVAQAKGALANILSHLRYCSWIEAEITSTRVFGEPVAILAELVKQQEEIAAAFQAKTDPQPAPEPAALPNQSAIPEVPMFPPIGQGEEMDKLATVPLNKTLQ
jgi:hypothetical protein